MTEPLRDENESPEPREVFQFGLPALLILTVVCAAVAALASSMRVPVLARGIVALYCMSLAAYAVLRVPYVLRGIRRSTRAWKRLDRKRRELETQVAEAKAALAKRRLADDDGAPEPGASRLREP